MIVKNEENFLADCLESVKNIADEIIVVDTGSTDRSVEIAKKYNSQIHKYTWCNDFSAARNESIKYAKGKWILWLDADERLQIKSLGELKKIIKSTQKPTVFQVQIHSPIKNGNYKRLSSAHRLFKNNVGIKFSGRVHEQISLNQNGTKIEEQKSNIIINHLGYDLEKDKQQMKSRRNKKLLEKMVSESPQNAYAHYTLAQHYASTDEHLKALQHFKIALNLNQFTIEMKVSLLNTTCETLIELGNLQEAKEKARQSITTIPEQVGGYYLLYKIEVENKNTAAAIKWLKKLSHYNLKAQNRTKKISTDVIIKQAALYNTIGDLYYSTGELENALLYFHNALEMDGSNIGLLKKITGILINNNNYAAAEQPLKLLCELTEENEQFFELLGTVYIKNNKFSEAILVFKKLLQIKPDNRKWVNLVAGLHGKIGDFESAREFLLLNQTP